MRATINDESSKQNHHLRTDSSRGHWGWKHLCVFFCGSFMGFLYCICYAFVRVCLYVTCGHLLGNCWPLVSRLWCLTADLSLSHWYPGSGVVLDCIDSWSFHPYLLWSTSELRVRLTSWNWFKPSSKIFYWPFQYGIFLWIICVIYVLCLPCFRVCLLLLCGHRLGKGWPLGSHHCFYHFPMWYPGSGVVLDCIVSWFLPSFLLRYVFLASCRRC